MFVLRSKVKIRDAGAELDAYGLAGTGAAEMAAKLESQADLTVAPIGAQLFVVVAPKNDERARALARGTLDDWHRALIRAGIPTIVAATQEAFVPQMANLDLVGGVSFRKGCYPGQEIVARTQYRGGLKRRMALAHVEGDVPTPGQSVFSPAFGDQSAGTVVNAAPDPAGGHDLLVVAQIESLREGALTLGAPGGAAVSIRSQPASEPAA
jgi:folate-binding protein YgfZ